MRIQDQPLRTQDQGMRTQDQLMRAQDQPMPIEDQPTAPHLETRSQLFSLRLTEWGEEVGLGTIS